MATTPPDQGTSTRPYLIRALHEWCCDNGFTPYLAVFVTPQVQVPREYVKNQEIVLNVGHDATAGLKLGNEWIEFKARFGGVARDIVVPVDHVVAIYARENGQGMAFPVPQPPGEAGPGRSGVPPRLSAVGAPSDAPKATTPAPRAPTRAGGAGGRPAPPSHPDRPEPPEPPPPRPALKRVK